MTAAEHESSGTELLRLARSTVEAFFGRPEGETPTSGWTRERHACFVTIQNRGELHGCIGSLEPTEALWENVRRHALNAAIFRSYGPRLSAEELPNLRFEVSVLSALEPIDFKDEAGARAALVPGRDGVLLTADSFRGVFLPQVWSKLATRETFLDHLKAKAGLSPRFWSDTVKLERFSVEEFHEPGFQL